MNHKYFFLYLKTGGGHLAPARSVTSFLKARYPEILDPMLIDGLQEAPKPIRTFIEDGYRQLQIRGRWLYAFLYFVNKWSAVARLNAWIVSYFVQPYLEREILSHRPEKIVIFHFFLIKPIEDILSRHKLIIPTLIVVTDPYTAHPLWFLRNDHRFIVFSEQLREHCVQKGIKVDNITVFPFILNEQFTDRPPAQSKEMLKKRMGFQPDKKLILIIGGADGIPRGKQIVKHLLRKNPGVELAIVCGKNQSLMQEMLALKDKSGSDCLSVFGYVDSVYELLHVSDIVITKCGASMFMETLLARKIPIVNNYLWEQEKGNVDFICRNHLGIYERSTRKLSSWISKLFADDYLYNSFNRNIEHAQLVNGVNQVSDFIVAFGAGF